MLLPSRKDIKIVRHMTGMQASGRRIAKFQDSSFPESRGETPVLRWRALRDVKCLLPDAFNYFIRPELPRRKAKEQGNVDHLSKLMYGIQHLVTLARGFDTVKARSSRSDDGKISLDLDGCCLTCYLCP
jgi:hypothetical protein